MKPYPVVLTAEALDDLIRLYDWIAERSGPDTAGRFVEDLEGSCRNLGRIPEAGRKRDDIRQGLRITNFRKRVTIAYALVDKRVEILRLFYAGRDWPRQIE